MGFSKEQAEEMQRRVDAAKQAAKRPKNRPGPPVGIDVLIEAYERLGSVWKVAREVGICGQSVHERLAKAGRIKPKNLFSEEDDARLVEMYEKYVSSGRLAELAVEFGRSKHFLCRQARRLGLTDIRRPPAPWVRAGMSSRTKEWLRNNKHPRGMAGKRHTAEAIARISEASADRWSSMTKRQRMDHTMKQMKARAAKTGSLVAPLARGTWKSGWREIGGKRKFFRSRWEANYARYLEWQKTNGLITEWEHEPETFWFEAIRRGTRSYLPDFRVTMIDGCVVYHEVKGWMDPASKTKLKRMKKYHPHIEIQLIDAKRYNTLKKQVSTLIHGWE